MFEGRPPQLSPLGTADLSFGSGEKKEISVVPPRNGGTKPDGYGYPTPKVEPRPRAVAIEGEEAPGTGGKTFDTSRILVPASDQNGTFPGYGFDDPSVNDRGNVAFFATYGNTGMSMAETNGLYPGGAGIFFWNREKDLLVPVALSGGQTMNGEVIWATEDPKGYVGIEPEINKRDQIVFLATLEAPNGTPGLTADSVIDEYARGHALLQATPTDEKCERFYVDVIAKYGDSLPYGAGTFLAFDGHAQNKSGDVAFIAKYFTQNDLPTIELVPAYPEHGVFLFNAYKKEIRTVVREGDYLPGTHGGKLCGGQNGQMLVPSREPPLEGPWINDERVVTFIANCIEDGYGQRLHELEGSVFIQRPGEDLAMFLKMGSKAPRWVECGACTYDQPYGDPVITDIEAGQPGLSDDKAVFKIEVQEGYTRYSLIVTKRLCDDAYSHDLKVCAKEDEELYKDFTLGLGVPSIGSEGVIGFAGHKRGWMNNYYVEKTAVFSCYRGDVELLTAEGKKKPVGMNNEFGYLTDASNSNRYLVFLDEGKQPTGVFIIETDPQL